MVAFSELEVQLTSTYAAFGAVASTLTGGLAVLVVCVATDVVGTTAVCDGVLALAVAVLDAAAMDAPALLVLSVPGAQHTDSLITQPETLGAVLGAPDSVVLGVAATTAVDTGCVTVLCVG